MTARQKLKTLGVAELVTAFREAALRQSESLEEGDYRAANKAVDSIDAVYLELKQRGEEPALLGLLADADAGVRYWSAAHALEFSPKKAVPVLKELIATESIHGVSAKLTLGGYG